LVDFGRLWLIGGSTRVRNASEFRMWFLAFDAYDAPKYKNAGRLGMTLFETAVFLVVIAGVMCLVVKAYEWRQDVLYGPYLRPDDRLDIR